MGLLFWVCVSIGSMGFVGRNRTYASLVHDHRFLSFFLSFFPFCPFLVSFVAGEMRRGKCFGFLNGSAFGISTFLDLGFGFLTPFCDNARVSGGLKVLRFL